MLLLQTLTAILAGLGTVVLLWSNYGLLAWLLAPVVASLATGATALIFAAIKFLGGRPALPAALSAESGLSPSSGSPSVPRE